MKLGIITKGDKMIRAIATDLDGTLFYPKRMFRLISSANKQFIRNASKAGKDVILVTGRNIFVPHKVERKFALTKDVSIVACNGARVIYQNKVVSERPILPDKALKLYWDLISHKAVKTIMVFSNSRHMYVDAHGMNPFMRLLGLIGMSLQGAYYEPFKLGRKATEKHIQNPDTKIYKIMPWFGLGEKGVQMARTVFDEFKEKYGNDFEIWFSGSAIEIMEKGTNKAHALKELLKFQNIETEEVAVVGDSGNDIPLFENFTNSFVMGQAPDEVKEKAKVVLKSFDDLENYIK